MLWYRPGDTLRVEFPTADPETGDAANADSLPVASLSRNGTVDGAVVVAVANKATGVYEATCDIPDDYDEGDIIAVRVTASIGDVDGVDIVFQDRLTGYNFAASAPFYVTPLSSSASVGEVTPWAEQIIVYKRGPFGPFTIAISENSEPLDCTGKTLTFTAALREYPDTRFTLNATGGKLTINIANVTINDGSTHTQIAGVYDCSIRDADDFNRVIAFGEVNVVELPQDV